MQTTWVHWTNTDWCCSYSRAPPNDVNNANVAANIATKDEADAYAAAAAAAVVATSNHINDARNIADNDVRLNYYAFR